MSKTTTLLTPPHNKKISFWFFSFSVFCPLFALVFESYTQICAQTFFDPLPTYYHQLLVLFVPLSNLMLWWTLRYNKKFNVKILFLFSSLSIGISGYYSLIFLPIIPISSIAILFFGIGLLGFSPIVSFISTIQLRQSLKQSNPTQTSHKTYTTQGLLLALFFFIVLDLSSAITYLGTHLSNSEQNETREKGIKLLRQFGNNDLLLRLSYDGSRRATGLLSFILLMSTNNDRISSIKIREIFYRVTGELFYKYPPPYSGGLWKQFNDFSFDADQGGVQVGQKVKGLYLITSRIDGSIDSNDGVAYIEWIFEFKNHSFRQREIRLQLALPPKSVVSRASLWVKNEEKEAAFAPKKILTKIYKKIVQSRRDPLLITTLGTDSILAQAFPAASNGGTIQFKIGITVPLNLQGLKQASFVLPAIVDRNFSIDKNTKHSLWFESHSPLHLNFFDHNKNVMIKNKKIKPELYRLEGNISDKDLSQTQKVITAQRDPNIIQSLSSFNDNEWILQRIVNIQTKKNDALLILLDGSLKMAPHIDDIIISLEQIPLGKMVGMMIASDVPLLIHLKPWTHHHKKNIINVLRTFKFIGGQDNAPSLAKAIKILEQYEEGEILWIHAPQGFFFNSSKNQIEQSITRLIRLPKISLFSLYTGSNKLVEHPMWTFNSRTISRTHTVKNDLSLYFKSLFTTIKKPIFQRTLILSKKNAKKGSKHIARLWAKNRIDTLLTKKAPSLIKKNTQKAIELSINYQLVTAVSGALVLENKQQYKDNHLMPVNKNTIPTIPEPHQWILAFIMVAFILWFFKRNKLYLTKKI
jgi:hypothetical protein